MFNPRLSAPEIPTRSLLFQHALATAYKGWRRNLPPPPASLTAIEEACARLGPRSRSTRLLFAQPVVRGVLDQIRSRLFEAPGRESEAQAWWQESLATALLGGCAAQECEAPIATVFSAGLLHRAGEALALKLLARVELEYRQRLDTPARRDWCATRGYELTERLVRSWRLSPEVGSCVLGWRRFGEFPAASSASAALYFGRLFATETLQPDLCVPGAIDTAVAELGLSAEAAARIRAEGPHVRELIQTLEWML